MLIVRKRLSVAVDQRDHATILLFVRLYPLLGLEEEGLQAYIGYLKKVVSMRLRLEFDQLVELMEQSYSSSSVGNQEPYSAVWHSAGAACSGKILLGQNLTRPFGTLLRAECFGHDSAQAKPYWQFGTLLEQSVQERFCSGRTVLAVWHSVGAECSFFLEDMSESSVSVSSPEEDVVISSSSSSRSGRVLTSSSKVGTSNPQLFRPLSSEPLRPSSSQPPPPSTSLPSPSLPAKNALGDVKDQAEDEANPKPWYTADEKSSKMSTEDLVELLREYPLPVGWYARLPGLQEPANYGTKYETGIYEEQVKSGYRLPLYPFALRFFEYYHMASGVRSRIKVSTPDTSSLAVLIKGNFRLTENRILTKWPAEVEKHRKEAFLASCKKPKERGKKSSQVQSCPLLQRRQGLSLLTTLRRSLRRCLSKRIPSFVPNGLFTPMMLGCQIMYASGSEMLSRFEMVRQVAAEEAQQKREALKEAEEATRRAEDLSIRDFLDGNAGDEWLKKRTDDDLEIYELGFAKAKEMFAERFPDIPLDDFILPAVISPSGEIVLPSEARDAAASHPPGEGPSGDAPEPWMLDFVSRLYCFQTELL
ncbi:hypothetical protein RJ639_003477 [Escallonia herrerae]|uniref:Uncharacterized protein n=1 Tax=Escallonia herrerae TaxID=1293975 RepID=A0AA88W2X1_9ASTE|nr:hypothetical protein RJ639_003477 [Escallonia herrerae]